VMAARLSQPLTFKSGGRCELYVNNGLNKDKLVAAPGVLTCYYRLDGYIPV
jgi:hypothetical protein